MIPYKLGQTVNFVDSLGQPFVLKVTNDTTRSYSDEPEWVSVDEWLVQLKYEFSNFRISLVIDAVHSQIRITPSIYHNYYFNLKYDEEGKFVTDTTRSFNKQYYYDSLEINNKVYYDVVENIICKAHTSHENENKIPIGLLYNKTYGVLQLADKDKVLFTIDN
jgi:hypothetical protein